MKHNIINDIELAEEADQAFTDALQAFESYDYLHAIQHASTVMIISKNIEQRCAALMIFLNASSFVENSSENPKKHHDTTDKIMDLIYYYDK